MLTSRIYGEKGRLVVVGLIIAAVLALTGCEGSSGVNRPPVAVDDTASTPKDTVGSGSAFLSPSGIVVEADGSLVVVDANGVVRVDPNTGARTIISDASVGSGPAFITPLRIAVEAHGSLVVLDQRLKAVVRVDPNTGARTIVSDASVGTGPAFDFPSGAVEAHGSLVVADIARRAVIRVDPNTGDRTIISTGHRPHRSAVGIGPAFSHPLGIAVEADGNLVVVDPGLRAVVRVDPNTGARTIVSK